MPNLIIREVTPWKAANTLFAVRVSTPEGDRASAMSDWLKRIRPIYPELMSWCSTPDTTDLMFVDEPSAAKFVETYDHQSWQDAREEARLRSIEATTRLLNYLRENRIRVTSTGIVPLDDSPQEGSDVIPPA